MAIMYTRHAFYCPSKMNYLIFDAIGFLFVLLFIRLLNSYSFFYVRLELQVQKELSQIGASLLSQLNWLKLIEYRQRTANELESIKARVIQIRQRRVSQILFRLICQMIFLWFRPCKSVKRILMNQFIIIRRYFRVIIICLIIHWMHRKVQIH